MIDTSIRVTDAATPELQRLWKGLEGSGRVTVNASGARGAVLAAGEYHREYNKAGLWRGARSWGSGPSDFGDPISQGWNVSDVTEDGASISNNQNNYAHKVRGGTITPKKAKFLTIPLIREAKGTTARNYAIDNNTRLFRPKGKFVLMEKLADGSVRGVYALVKSVTQSPWPGALPSDDVIKEGFADGMNKALDAAK